VSIDCENNGTVILAVKDSGIRIPEDKLKDLFNQFTKTSKSGTDGERGTGLGLSIIKNLVEKHKGSIEVESEPGKGSTFRVIFPKCWPLLSDLQAADKNLYCFKLFRFAPLFILSPTKFLSAKTASSNF